MTLCHDFAIEGWLIAGKSSLKLKNSSSKEVKNVCANTMYFIAIPGIRELGSTVVCLEANIPFSSYNTINPVHFP